MCVCTYVRVYVCIGENEIDTSLLFKGSLQLLIERYG